MKAYYRRNRFDFVQNGVIMMNCAQIAGLNSAGKLFSMDRHYPRDLLGDDETALKGLVRRAVKYWGYEEEMARKLCDSQVQPFIGFFRFAGIPVDPVLHWDTSTQRWCDQFVSQLAEIADDKLEFPSKHKTEAVMNAMHGGKLMLMDNSGYVTIGGVIVAQVNAKGSIIYTSSNFMDLVGDYAALRSIVCRAVRRWGSNEAWAREAGLDIDPEQEEQPFVGFLRFAGLDIPSLGSWDVENECWSDETVLKAGELNC